MSFDCALTIWEIEEEYPIAKALGQKYQRSFYNTEPLNTKAPNVEICFETDDFEVDVARLRAHGVPLLHDVAQEVWGQMTLRFYDPDGNIVELGESIPCFCRRLHSEGLSSDGVAEKTGVPIEEVARFLHD